MFFNFLNFKKSKCEYWSYFENFDFENEIFDNANDTMIESSKNVVWNINDNNVDIDDDINDKFNDFSVINEIENVQKNVIEIIWKSVCN